jgi:hypothetical protein
MLLKYLACISLICSLVITPPALAAPLALANQGSPLLAQATTEISAEDITNFANAYEVIQSIKREAEMDMAEAVEAEGLTIEQFNTIAESQLDSTGDTNVEATEEETQQFRSAVEEIIAIRQAAEVDMQTAIEDEGLTVEEFNQILAQAEQDTDLQQQIREELSE